MHVDNSITYLAKNLPCYAGNMTNPCSTLSQPHAMLPERSPQSEFFSQDCPSCLKYETSRQSLSPVQSRGAMAFSGHCLWDYRPYS